MTSNHGWSRSTQRQVESASDHAVIRLVDGTDDLFCFMPDRFRPCLRRPDLLSATRP